MNPYCREIRVFLGELTSFIESKQMHNTSTFSYCIERDKSVAHQNLGN